MGDGYTPQPGDWVLFDEHVEVVTRYADGVLYTIGGDSMSNLSVNAHQYDGAARRGRAWRASSTTASWPARSARASGGTRAGATAPGAAAAGDATKASGSWPPATEARPACRAW